VALPTRSQARHALHLPDDAAVVGFVGRLASQKAPDALVSAFCKISLAHPNALLAIVGDGPLRQPLRRACEQLGLTGRVRWLGERNGQLAMPAFDVFVLPSRYEGLPYVLLEALLAGLPIVATDSAAAGLAVESGVNGHLVPVDDPNALARAVFHLLTDRNEREMFGRASRFRAARFSQQRMIEAIEGIYGELVEQ